MCIRDRAYKQQVCWERAHKRARHTACLPDAPIAPKPDSVRPPHRDRSAVPATRKRRHKCQAASRSTITVSGAGLVPGQTGHLTYDGGVVSDFAASPSGLFSVPFTIPDFAVTGRFGRISAKDSASNLLATTLLLINPSDAIPAS